MKKNQIKIPELKITVVKIEISLDGFMSYQTQKKGELVNWVLLKEAMHKEAQKGKK